MELNLTVEEAILLQSVLEEYVGDLRVEVGSTHDYSFRQELKRKEESLKGLLVKIERSHIGGMQPPGSSHSCVV